MQKHRRGFTLIEILIVLAIISLLMALLFPAFKRAEEGGRQANCASNLSQIAMAVKLYRQDERRYPFSLYHLMPSGTTGYDTYILANPSATPDPTPNSGGTGYLKTPERMLVCPDDDTEATVPRSSYGDISTLITYPASPLDTDTARYVWNYWGYNDEGRAYKTADEAAAAVALDPTYYATNSLLYKGGSVYNGMSNPFKYSMSCRFPPANTIITHCIYHRLPTSNLNRPDDIYTDTSNASGAKELVVRVDGSVKTIDAASMKLSKTWLTQNF